MPSVMIPPDAGTFSAQGMVLADRRRDFVRTVLLEVEECVARLDELLAPLREEPAAVEIVTADARYVGQSHELNVPADGELAEHFHRAHAAAYGYCDRARGVEVVNLRRAAVDPAPRPPLFEPRGTGVPVAGPRRMARAELDGAVRGPTVLTELTATTVVSAGWQAARLCDGTLYLERCE